MKDTIKITVIIIISLTIGCSSRDMVANHIQSKESHFAKHYLHQLINRNFDYVRKYLGRDIKPEATDQKLTEVVRKFPDGVLLSTELVGSNVYVSESSWHGNFAFEYQFSGGWAIATVVLQEQNGSFSVIGVNVDRTEASQRELNEFTIIGKSAIHYLVLMLAIVSPLFVLVTLYFCLKTPMPKRKWLWALFVVVGFGTISVNWTTGQYDIHLLSIHLITGSARFSGPVAPWVISASIPFGAIFFWFKRRGFIEASIANRSVSLTS